MKANPIGFVIGLVMLLVGALVTAYEKSETFRNIVKGLGSALLEFAKTYVVGLATALLGLYDVMAGVFSLDTDRIKKGFTEQFEGVKAMYFDAGLNAAKAFGEGYREEAAKQASQANKEYEQRRQSFQQKLKQEYEKRLQDRAAREKTARLERLKNEEADLKEHLARVGKDTEAEMRLKQQLVTNDAAQQLENEKKTAAERRIILAEAQQKRVDLAREFFKKQADERAKKAKEAAAQALKARLAEIEAEQVHQQMLAQVRQAAVAARGDELVTEMSALYTEGQLKIAALQAQAKKQIAQLTGSAEEKRKRTLDLEQKLAADVALVRQDVQKKQADLADKFNKEAYDKLRDDVQQKIDVIEDEAAREQRAFETPLHASLQLQQQYDNLRYKARQAAFTRELDLIEAALGKESAEFRKVAAAMEKDQVDHAKQSVKTTEDEVKAKNQLRKMEMQTASDVLSFAVDLLNQDAEARKKHHSLYVALASAKIIVDGAKEVQAIWEYAAEQPENSLTAGTFGMVLAGIQTALAVGRTAVALSQVAKTDSGGTGGSYYVGGATGTGAGVASSPLGQLLIASGMRVGSDGRLQDGSGHAVAGIVHEDEYVIPKWQLADPQVAAVTQWLEARRQRGLYEGGHTSTGSSGAALPVAAASPSTDGEKTYAVQTQMLDALLRMGQQLADVKQWQRELQVNLNLREAQARTDEYKQVQYNSAIRSKSTSN